MSVCGPVCVCVYLYVFAPVYIYVCMSLSLFIVSVGLYLGVKMFVIAYLYARFPRLKERHDGTYRLWRALPTDALLADNAQKPCQRVSEPCILSVSIFK